MKFGICDSLVIQGCLSRVALGRSVRYHNQFGISVSRALGIQDPPKRIDTYPKLMDTCPKLMETCPQNLGTIPENGRKEIAQHANSLYIGPEGPYMGPWGPWVPESVRFGSVSQSVRSVSRPTPDRAQPCNYPRMMMAPKVIQGSIK